MRQHAADGRSGLVLGAIFLFVAIAIFIGAVATRGPAVALPRRDATVVPAAQTVGPVASDLVYDSEFNGPAGAGPNDGLARPLWLNDGCSPHGCMGTLAAFKPENAQQDGLGSLVLTARVSDNPNDICGAAGACRYASSRLTMLDWAQGGTPSWGQEGGHFEARLQAPRGQGLWPAFWTVGSDQAHQGWPGSGEIDIFEAVGQRPWQVVQYIHGPRRGADHMLGQHTAMTNGDISGWHTYAVDWDPSPNGYMAWSIDGQVQRVVHASEAGSVWVALMEPHSMIIDLAVGGWAGEPDPAAFPAAMRVDYIRVYKNSFLRPDDPALASS